MFDVGVLWFPFDISSADEIPFSYELFDIDCPFGISTMANAVILFLVELICRSGSLEFRLDGCFMVLFLE